MKVKGRGIGICIGIGIGKGGSKAPHFSTHAHFFSFLLFLAHF